MMDLSSTTKRTVMESFANSQQFRLVNQQPQQQRILDRNFTRNRESFMQQLARTAPSLNIIPTGSTVVPKFPPTKNPRSVPHKMPKEISLGVRGVRFGTFKTVATEHLEINAENLKFTVKQDLLSDSPQSSAEEKRRKKSDGDSEDSSSHNYQFSVSMRHFRGIRYHFGKNLAVMFILVSEYCSKKICEALKISSGPQPESQTEEEELDAEPRFDATSDKIHFKYITIIVEDESTVLEMDRKKKEFEMFFQNVVEPGRIEKAKEAAEPVPSPLLCKLSCKEANKLLNSTVPPQVKNVLYAPKSKSRPLPVQSQKSAGVECEIHSFPDPRIPPAVISSKNYARSSIHTVSDVGNSVRPVVNANIASPMLLAVQSKAPNGENRVAGTTSRTGLTSSGSHVVGATSVLNRTAPTSSESHVASVLNRTVPTSSGSHVAGATSVLNKTAPTSSGSPLKRGPQPTVALCRANTFPTVVPQNQVRLMFPSADRRGHHLVTVPARIRFPVTVSPGIPQQQQPILCQTSNVTIRRNPAIVAVGGKRYSGVVASTPIVPVINKQQLPNAGTFRQSRQATIKQQQSQVIIDVSEDESPPSSSTGGSLKRRCQDEGSEGSSEESPKKLRKTAGRSCSPMKTCETLFVYPPQPERGGISVHFGDLKCLEDGEFLNDTIIDFYLKYLVRELLPEEQRSRIHVFNSFFYNRLNGKPSNGARGGGGAQSGIWNEARIYERHAQVKQWTKNVDLFEKDYILIPVNVEFHWLLIIVCFAGKYEEREVKKELKIPKKENSVESEVQGGGAENSEESEVEDSKRNPCIMLCDSLNLGNRERYPIVRKIREYLRVEWEVRKPNLPKKTFDPRIMKGFYPKLPQQSNWWDCGVFLLQYSEEFLLKPPESFPPRVQHTLVNWFPVEKAEGKRKKLKKLIVKMARDNGYELSEDDNSRGAECTLVNFCFDIVDMYR